MALGFSPDFKEQVRSRTDIVALVGEVVTLEPRRGGREHVGLCPFHDDHNPSLTVSPERQSYKCWSCGEGGDCYSFVMKTRALDFPAALEMLAERAGLEMPRRQRKAGGGNRDRKERLLDVLKWAEDEFHRFLLSARDARPAREYLAERGFGEETIARFRLGYHPEDWEWLLRRARDRFSVRDLAAARLARERRDGSGFRDDFVGRVLFPIRDVSGRPVAFGGRTLPGRDRDDAPKYLNSPESELFAKSGLLYGFDVAREAVRRSRTAVVVEGYTDCVALHQHGLGNVVGTLGTALTDSHVHLLKRFARKVVLLYDGDEAGQRAAERSMAKFLAQQIDLRILTLPAGVDPADYIAEQGADSLREEIESAREAWAHKLQVSLARHEGSVDGRERVLEEMLELLAAAPRLAGSPREDMILGRLAQRVAVPEATVRRRLAEVRSAHSQRRDRGRSDESGNNDQNEPAARRRIDRPTTHGERLEWDLLEIIFAAPETAATVRGHLAVEEFHSEPLRRLLQAAYDLVDRDIAPAYERVTAAVEDPDLKRLALIIDEEARKKNVAEKLREGKPPDGERGGMPALLALAIDNLTWRRHEQSHQRSKTRMAEHAASSGGLDADAKALLRRLTEFNQKRATKKPSH